MMSFGSRLLHISHRDWWVSFSPLINYDEIDMSTVGIDGVGDQPDIFEDEFFKTAARAETEKHTNGVQSETR